MPRRQVKLSLNDKEYGELAKLADTAKLPLSTYVKEVVFSQDRAKYTASLRELSPERASVNDIYGSTVMSSGSKNNTVYNDKVLLLSDVLVSEQNSDHVGGEGSDSIIADSGNAGVAENIALTENTGAAENAKLNFSVSGKRKVEINISI